VGERPVGHRPSENLNFEGGGGEEANLFKDGAGICRSKGGNGRIGLVTKSRPLEKKRRKNRWGKKALESRSRAGKK